MKLSILFFLNILSSSCNSIKKNDKIDSLKELPVFNMLSVKTLRLISIAAIHNGTPVILCYFSSTCEHCQNEIKSLLENKQYFKGTKFFLVSNDSIADLQKFIYNYHIDSALNFFVAKDYQFSFYNIFHPPLVPYLVIYNSKRQLKRIYIGEANLQSVIADINDSKKVILN